MQERFDSIRFQKYIFVLKTGCDAKLPLNKTSMFRGGAGEMLLRKHCLSDRNCEGCGFNDSCIVPNIYYHRFKIRPDFAQGKESEGYIFDCSDLREHFKAGDQLEFSLTLFGNVIVYFSTIMDAVYMLGQIGVGEENAHYDVVNIRNVNGEVIMKDNQVYLDHAAPLLLEDYVDKRLRELDASENDVRIRLKMLSPCSIKSKGELKYEFDPDALANSSYRRVYVLNCFEGNEMDQHYGKDSPIEILDQETRKVTVPRFSSTQGKKLYLTGFVGEAEMKVKAEFLPYLIAGEILHIGKNTSMGFGKYSLSVN